MPNAEEVKSGKWDDIKVLFNNGDYSIIFGKFEGSECLGERWNGKDDSQGFPQSHGYPQWHVVPDFLEIPILLGALHESEINSNNSYIDKLRETLSNFILVKVKR